jgi:hypothetical protein
MKNAAQVPKRLDDAARRLGGDGDVDPPSMHFITMIAVGCWAL